MSGLQLVEVDDDTAWDAGVAASLQGTVFCRSAYLRSLAMPFKRLAVRSGAETLALLPVVEDDSGQCMVQPAYTPQLGPLFLHGPQALARDRVLDEHRVCEFLIGELVQRYREIALSLSWHSHDLRAYLWHNYHAPELPRFVVQPRYTALIDLTALDPEAFTAELRRARRRELKQAQDYTISEEPDIDRFMALYLETFARQGITLPSAESDLVRRITVAALDQGYGRLSSCVTPKGVGSMNVFLYDQRRAYSLFAGNAPDLRDSGAVTRLLCDNIFEARRRGLAELDMVGVNSPARGDWKLSFNPALTLYFGLRYTAAAG